MLNFDLKYPDELHELNDDYPVAPEKLEISHDILSNIVAILQINMTQKLVVLINYSKFG